MVRYSIRGWKQALGHTHWDRVTQGYRDGIVTKMWKTAGNCLQPSKGKHTDVCVQKRDKWKNIAPSPTPPPGHTNSYWLIPATESLVSHVIQTSRSKHFVIDVRLIQMPQHKQNPDTHVGSLKNRSTSCWVFVGCWQGTREQDMMFADESSVLQHIFSFLKCKSTTKC